MKQKIAVVGLSVMALTMTAWTSCSEKSAKEQTVENTNKKVTLASGLSYVVLKAGDEKGEMPTAGKRVTVHYTGWLDKNGEPQDVEKPFDSSVKRGVPFKFIIGVGQVIKGWDEGVMLMKTGEKRRIFIPANLGYGARGAGAAIPPNADLIFDVEMISIG